MSKETTSEPLGELALQTLAMPKDTNANGDIFGGWLVSQMDLAAGIISKKVTKGRSTTVAIQNVTFLRPVSVGSTVSCYCCVVKRGRTSAARRAARYRILGAMRPLARVSVVGGAGGVSVITGPG